MRAYTIVLDGHVIGEIANNQDVELQVSPGQHSLFLKIDWCMSQVVNFEINGEIAFFECGSSLRGFRLLLAIFYLTILRKRYIRLNLK